MKKRSPKTPCPVCKKSVRVLKNGNLARHKPYRRPYDPEDCAGSKTPAPPQAIPAETKQFIAGAVDTEIRRRREMRDRMALAAGLDLSGMSDVEADAAIEAAIQRARGLRE